MPDDRSINRTFIHWGVLLSVLCLGVVGGALLGGRSVPAPDGGGSRTVSVPRALDSLIVARAEQPNENRLELSDLSASAYSPLPGGETDRGSELPDQALDYVPEPDASVDAGAAPDSQLPASRPAAAAGPGPTRDNVASMRSTASAGALLFAVATGEETILFDVGVPGARVLPDNIAGAWAWVGSCSRVTVEISQPPGSVPGGVRGVGAAIAGDRYGWVVPASGCSARRGPARIVRASAPADAPWGVTVLEALGSAGCESGLACAWFIGVDDRGRAVALLARSRRDDWIRLGGVQ